MPLERRAGQSISRRCFSVQDLGMAYKEDEGHVASQLARKESSCLMHELCFSR
jgi:hypothetical protein